MKTRDEWLAEIAPAMATWFDEFGFPLPTLQMRSGFPSKGRRAQDTAESWSKEDDGSVIIFVRPDRPDPIEVTAAVALQMCKIASGPKDKNGYLYRHLTSSIGLGGKKKSVLSDPEFLNRVTPIIKTVGPLPNPGIAPTDPSANTKQTTRQIKVTCKNCGYVARVSRKWLSEVGAPLCPRHGQMTPAD